MSALTRRLLYVVAVVGVMVAWLMWSAVGVYTVDENVLLKLLPESAAVVEDGLPALFPEQTSVAVGGGAYGGVITTPIDTSATAITVAGVIVLVLGLTVVVLRLWRAVIPILLAMAASVALVVAVDVVAADHEPWIGVRPLPTAVMVVACVVALATAAVLVSDAIRNRSRPAAD